MDEPVTCPTCGYLGNPVFTPTPHLTHYGKLTCHHCSRHLKWVAKPDDERTKHKRPADHKDLVDRYGRGFCEMCLRQTGSLQGRQHLVGHHVIEFKDGGTSARDNVWIVCDRCHALIHWVRKMVGTDFGMQDDDGKNPPATDVA